MYIWIESIGLFKRENQTHAISCIHLSRIIHVAPGSDHITIQCCRHMFVVSHTCAMHVTSYVPYPVPAKGQRAALIP